MKKVEIVIPAHNEEEILESSLNKLYSHLNKIKDFKWEVIIGENGSTDNTFKLAKSLEKKFTNLKTLHIKDPSRDGVLKEVWSKSRADVLIYMDADMSTDPKHVYELIKAIANEKYDVAIGSRMKKGAKIKRSLIRRLMSLVYYSILLPVVLPVGVKDTQCGFKAINQKVAKNIIPKLVKENGFLDTELIAVARYKNYMIKEIPIEWTEAERTSTMNVYRNISRFLKNILKTRYKIRNKYYD